MKMVKLLPYQTSVHIMNGLACPKTLLAFERYDMRDLDQRYSHTIPRDIWRSEVGSKI